MSRSYKYRKMGKIVFYKDPNSKFFKQYANIRIRHTEDVPNGKAYKKFFCSYEICDFKWVEKKYTANEFREKWNNHDKTTDPFYDRYSNWKDAYRIYLRGYIKK